MRRNTCRVTLFTPSLHIGGVEKVLVNLANNLASKGYTVDFVVYSREGELINELNSRVRIVELGGARLRNSIIRFFKYLKNSGSEIVISGPTYPNIISILSNMILGKKKNVLVTHHNFQDKEMCALGLRGRVMPSLIKLFYRHSTRVIAVSDSLKDSLIRNFNLNSALISRIYNPVIDADFYTKAEEYDPASILPKSFERYIISVGRLEEVKNFPLLLNAFAILKNGSKHRDLKLVLVGDGVQKDALGTLAFTLGIKDDICFTGALKNPLPLIKKATLFVQPSYSESFSIVIVEALALATPVIATETAGAKEVLSDGKYGTLIPINSIEKLTSALQSKLDDPYREDLFLDSYLEQFKSEVICEAYIRLF